MNTLPLPIRFADAECASAALHVCLWDDWVGPLVSA